MIFFTGDIHSKPERFSKKSGFDHTGLTKSDYVIVAGDFGLVWNNGAHEKYWLKWLHQCPWTTLWVDGNHENHDMLDAMPTEWWHGGQIHRINDSVLHLMRGQVFDLDGTKVFSFGGADSVDKAWRKPQVSWWERELPSTAEYELGLYNLSAHNNSVDYIVSHTCPGKLLPHLLPYNEKPLTAVEKYLDMVDDRASFKKWVFGHFHENMVFDDRYVCLYENIVSFN